jgi:hypothetical protein
LEEWQWAFERNPAGQRIFVATDAGRVIAQYAGWPARAWIAGQERRFVQIVDSMVLPAYRHGGADGVFARTASAFFSAFGRRDGDSVFYGWPNARAFNAGQRLLNYEVVRNQCVLVRASGGERIRGSSDAVTLTHLDEQVQWLYERCAGEYGASIVRDARYLTWRYLEHPLRRYKLFGVRDGAGILRGLAVYRRANLFGGDLGLVAEWLVPPSEAEVVEPLLQALFVQAQEEGVEALVVLFPEWSSWFTRFQEHGFVVHPTDYLTVARSFDPRVDMQWLRECWWYQLGDFDLV